MSGEGTTLQDPGEPAVSGGDPAGTDTTDFGPRDLLLASRPVSWINTALPFLAAAFEVTRGLDAVVILGTLYFLLPYNLLLYGVNDLFDYASDVANPRKQSLEGGLVAPAHARRLVQAIVATNVPFLLVLAWLGGPVAALALLLTVLVAIAYSAPPVRTKVRPFLDSLTSALHFVLPAVCGFLVAGRGLDELPWVMLGGFLAWGVASHALGAIQDVAYDRAAGIGSIATALGGRQTAWVSLAGYGLAVLAALTIAAPWGLVSALALAPYLLLPLMVIVRDDESQARRAWRAFMQLNIPVGFVLTQALLRHWGITAYDPWQLGVWLATGAAGWVLLNLVLTRVATRRRAPVATAGDPDLPALTIVVPCRNEAARLPACLASLVAQHYRGEVSILVVDDGSTDGSREMAAGALAPLGALGRVIAAPPTPKGWTGKGWAVATGVREASTELVLALDADTTLVRDGASRLVRELEATDASLLSGITRYAMPSIGERATMPGYPLLLFGFVPVWASVLAAPRVPSLAFAYGPVQLVRRAAYLETGGHAATPGSHREDVDLARTFARAGRRVHTTHAAGMGATRHYSTAGEVLASWSRILPGYTGGSLVLALLTIAGELLAYGLPVLLPLLAALLAPERLAESFIPLGVLFAARIVLALTERQPIDTVALHPVTVVATVAAQVAAIAALVTGRSPAWRGRPMPDLAAPPTGVEP